MTKGIFVTATGTDVGKTFVSALMVKKMRDLGFNCGYYKPVLSGAYKKDNILIPGDCEFVLKVSGMEGNPFDYASYIFETAVSPHLASTIENNPIFLDKIVSDFENFKSKFDYVVIEGAGGIICPFNLDKENQLLLPDVIKALNLGVVIVSSASLGSINSAVLTSEYAKSKNIDVRGFILNNYDVEDFMQRDNKIQIEKLSGVNVVAEIEKDANNMNISENDIVSLFKEI